MAQFILNISDEKKAFKMFEFLRTLNYIDIQELSEENAPILESDKVLMRKRLETAQDSDFKDWNDVKKKFDVIWKLVLRFWYWMLLKEILI